MFFIKLCPNDISQFGSIAVLDPIHFHSVICRYKTNKKASPIGLELHDGE